MIYPNVQCVTVCDTSNIIIITYFVLVRIGCKTKPVLSISQVRAFKNDRGKADINL